MAKIDDPARREALRRTGLLDSSPEDDFDRVTRLASAIIGAPVSLVSLVDVDRQFFKSQVGLPAPYDAERQTPLSHSFCQHVVAMDEVLLVTDARQDDRLRDNHAIRDLNVIAYLGVPLKMPDGSVLGSLCAIDGVPRMWTDKDVAALRDLAAIVIDQILLRDEVRRRKAAEEEQRLLIDELHHRVKNTLAVVQAMINITLRRASSLEEFEQKLQARIVALGEAHALLVDHQWRSVPLAHLVKVGLATYGNDDQIDVSGPDVRVPADLAVKLGMCLHELMTNATKHGALSVPGGKLEIAWTVTSADGEQTLSITWIERDGPAVTVPENHGFGSVLLQRLSGGINDGRIELDYASEGLRALIAAKLHHANDAAQARPEQD